MGAARFPRRARLAAQTDFQRVFQDAVRSSDGSFTVLARSNGLGFPRLGLAVSRKHVKTAAARNRVKRLIRESFRSNQHRLGPVDVVVLARRGVERKPNRELLTALEKHWSRLNE